MYSQALADVELLDPHVLEKVRPQPGLIRPQNFGYAVLELFHADASIRRKVSYNEGT